MSDLIHEHSNRVLDEDGTSYYVRIYADERPGGTWAAWIEFAPVDPRRATLRTGEETSQPSRNAIEYWASGLEPVYLVGALARAQGRLPTGVASERIVSDD